MKKYLLIFITAFTLNVLWEHAHAFLYVHYKGSPITEFILFRAALFDAVAITFFALLFLSVPFFRDKIWILILWLVVFAIGLEMWALFGERWLYADAMPLVPILNVGLTPVLQLGITTYLAEKISKRLLFLI